MNIEYVVNALLIALVTFLTLGTCFLILLVVLVPVVVFSLTFRSYWQKAVAREDIQTPGEAVVFALKNILKEFSSQPQAQAEGKTSKEAPSPQPSQPQTVSPPETRTSPQARTETPTAKPKTYLPPIDLGSNELLLYILTWLLEIPGALARLGIVYLAILLLLAPVLLIVEVEAQRASAIYNLAVGAMFLLSLGNMVISGLTAIGLIPIGLSGSQFTRFAMGAREPSNREMVTVREAFLQIRESVPFFIDAPHHWFVLDNPLLVAHTIGKTLYLTKGLINSDHLVAVLVHNLGHLNAPDARLILALQRLILPPVFLVNSTTASNLVPGLFSAPAAAANQPAVNQVIGLPQEKTVFVNLPNPTMMYFMGIWLYLLLLLLSIAGGGLGLLLLSPFWIWYFREGDYRADYFAAKCGFAQELVDYLEAHQFFDAAVPYFMSVQPYTELRIDKLLTYLERQGQGENFSDRGTDNANENEMGVSLSTY